MEQELEYRQDPRLRRGERRRQEESVQSDSEYDQRQDFSDTERFWIRVTLYKLVYSICGLLIGLACIVVGATSFLSQLTVPTSGTVGINELTGVALWAVLFIIGPLVISLTRLVVNPRAFRETLSKRFWKTINAFALAYSVCGLISGAVTIVCGIVLSLKMVIGGTGWVGHTAQAALGVIVFCVGLLVITITRYSEQTVNSAKNLSTGQAVAKMPTREKPSTHRGIRDKV
ncbi:hypothetical protein ACFL6S_19770 [Candidatus Poribacteria bacterium]